MAYIHDDVLDNGLSELPSHGNSLVICSQLPTTYLEASSTYLLATKSSPTISSPQDRTPTGRKVTVSAITDGTSSGTGSAAAWAILDTVGGRLLAAQALSESFPIQAGRAWTLTAFDIGFPGP
jgi:uncharacterized membrane-anchored protein YitT (DUF2179 family)